MHHARLGMQSDLFEMPPGDAPAAQPRHGGLAEPPDSVFVDGVRQELTATLARVQMAADALPWRDLTAAYLAELRFRSISRWLPPAEAAHLVATFDAELDRLYAVLAAAPDS